MIKRTLNLFIAVICIILWIIGILIPIVPGWPFLIIAITIISPTHKDRMIAWIKEKLKKT